LESFSLVALLLAIYVVLHPGLGQGRYLVRAIFTGAIGFILLYHLGKPLLQGDVHQRNLIAFYCLGLGLWSICERKANTVGLPSLVGLPLIALTGLSFVLLFKGSAVFSQLVAVVCTSLGAVFTIGLIMPKWISRAAIIPFLSVFAVAFVAAGHFYLDINPWTLIALCIPFFVMWVRSFLPVPKAAIPEFLTLAVVSGAPVGYIVFTVFKTAGPLY
jgi:hypothetical protein